VVCFMDHQEGLIVFIVVHLVDQIAVCFVGRQVDLIAACFVGRQVDLMAVCFVGRQVDLIAACFVGRQVDLIAVCFVGRQVDLLVFNVGRQVDLIVFNVGYQEGLIAECYGDHQADQIVECCGDRRMEECHVDLTLIAGLDQEDQLVVLRILTTLEVITGGSIVVLAGPAVTDGLKMDLHHQETGQVWEAHLRGRVGRMIREWKWREEGGRISRSEVWIGGA